MTEPKTKGEKSKEAAQSLGRDEQDVRSEEQLRRRRKHKEQFPVSNPEEEAGRDPIGEA